MNHNRSFTLGIALILILVITACAPAQADSPCPTSKPLSCPTAVAQMCPTAQACPTVSVAVPSTGGGWLDIINNYTEVRIIFEAGDKCTVNAPSILNKGLHYYQIYVKDQTYEDYAVIFQILDEGKTLADLEAYSKRAKQAPSWSHTISEDYITPGSNSYHTLDVSEGPIYISCFVSDKPNNILRITDYGPVEVK